MNVVVHSEDGTVSFLVDEIGDVVEVEDSTFEPAPEMLRERVRSMIVGVHKLNGRLLHVLDTGKACQMMEEPKLPSGGLPAGHRFDEAPHL
jgi:purine-binding chemotaxis protein CheW